MNEGELLAEVEDLLRTMPNRATLANSDDENFSWFGRVAAFVEEWDPIKSPALEMSIGAIQSGMAPGYYEGVNYILVLLHKARAGLRMRTVGPTNLAVEAGRVFDYFDEIRKVIETATKDVFFIDPYLDAEFVSRYLPHIANGVAIRLLARERLPTLVPAVKQFCAQSGKSVSVRSAPGYHDRFVLVDSASCYQSGASFKDGAKKAPTTLTQITDAFSPLRHTYEQIWAHGKIEL